MKVEFSLKNFTLISQATEIVTIDGMPNIGKLILEGRVFQEKQQFLTSPKHIFLIFPSLKYPTFFNVSEIPLLTRTAVSECQIEL